MKIVIDIPEEVYNRIALTPRCANFFDAYNDRDMFVKAIQNGTPLPKGHGRLIDADYKVSSDGKTVNSVCGYLAPTIIDADKESD